MNITLYFTNIELDAQYELCFENDNMKSKRSPECALLTPLYTVAQN